MTIGVYRIDNLVSGKCYIGSSFEVEKRIIWHYRKLLIGKHINKHLQYAYNLYGKKAFAHKILETIEFTSNDAKENDTILRMCEQKHIDSVDSSLLYNQCLVAGSTKGRKHSVETRNKIGQSLKGKIGANKGKTFSLERKQAMSVARKGKPTGLKGIKVPCKNKAVVQINNETGEVVAIHSSGQAAQQKTGIYASRISEVCHGKKAQAGGFIWKFEVNMPR